MANVTIPNLTSATTITPSTDLMVLEQTEGTRKATLSQIFTSSATSGSGLGITSGGVYAIKSGLDSDISDINTLLGSTSIASIGDGTVTGAVSQINSDLSDKSGYINASNKLLNHVDLSNPVTFTEDAWVFARVWSNATGRSAILYLDDSSIISAVSPTQQYVSFPVKAGQILSARTDSSDYHYQVTAYGML